MALMYDMETVNRAMTEAAKLYDPKQKSIRVKRVLDIFAGMKPVQAVHVVRCRECKHRGEYLLCPMVFQEEYHDCDGDGFYTTDNTRDDGFCHMGAIMDGRPENVQTY